MTDAGRDARLPLSIVVAIGRNGEIGQGGRLPWRMPSDLARFRALTVGKPMIMGRRTFDSIGRALPNRDSIVVTRDDDHELPQGVYRVSDPAAALDLAQTRATALGADEIALIGGATLFEQMMPQVERLYTTLVDLAPEADTFFPPIDVTIWRECRRERPARHAEDEAACLFIDYVRAPAASG